jgi:hypothetical protein
MATLKKGKQGTPMQAVEVSPERRKRTAKRRVKQEERWARKSGEARSRVLSDEERSELGI